MSDFLNLRSILVPKDATVITQCSDGLTRVLSADGEWHEAVSVADEKGAPKLASVTAYKEWAMYASAEEVAAAQLLRAQDKYAKARERADEAFEKFQRESDFEAAA